MHAAWLVLAHAAILGQLAVTPEQHIDRARACLNNLDFQCAERAFLALQPRLTEVSPALSLEARVLGAEIALSTERWTDAEARLLQVLIAQPRFAPADAAWPPKWHEVLAAARRRVPDRSPPHIVVDLPGEALLDTPLLVRARIRDPSGVDRPTLRLDALAIVMTSTDGVTFQAVVPAARVREPEVSVWIEAHDAFGNGPARTPPLSIPVAPRVARAQSDAWWLWALAGGAVVAGGVVTALVLGTRDAGAVTVDIVWPTR